MLNKRFTLFVISVLILFAGCVSERVNELQSVEIRQYNGENLSSFIELRDVSIKGPQNIDIKSYRLELSGLVNNPRKYTYDEVLAHQKYKKVVQINCVEGWKSKNLWEGILLKDVLDEAGLDPKANTIIFYAYDGYSTSLPLEYILDKNILLGYKINDITLTPSTGYPFILVAEDKWGYKWIKWITKIEVSSNKEYGGYWEKRGYSNSADLNKSFFD